MVVDGEQVAFVLNNNNVSTTCGVPSNVYDFSVACCEYVEGSAEVCASVEGSFVCDGVDAPTVG
jgi:hypothetical protein